MYCCWLAVDKTRWQQSLALLSLSSLLSLLSPTAATPDHTERHKNQCSRNVYCSYVNRLRLGLDRMNREWIECRGRKNKGGQFDVCANEINVFVLCEKYVIVGGWGMILFCMQLQYMRVKKPEECKENAA